MAKPRKGLTPRQDQFARNLAKGGSQTQAAREAGYSEVCAQPYSSKLMLNPVIQAAVEIYRASRESKQELTRERVLNSIAEIGAVALSTGQLGSAMKGQELLGRALGVFVDRSQNINVNVDATAAQLEGLIAAAKRRQSAALPIALDVSHGDVSDA